MENDFLHRVDAYTKRVDDRLDDALPLATARPQRLHEAMRYAVFNGGKRVRPLLTYAAGECLDVPPERLDAPAVAIELIHAFSLVHDDLPAMDDDDLRRGKPTVHIQYDEATAILAADALQPLAFRVLAEPEGPGTGTRVKLVRLLAAACGSTGMTGGQSIDLAAEGRALPVEDLEHMYALKTGALIHAAVMSAAILKDDLPRAKSDALDAFGRSIGIAFQIIDDILDVEGETEVIGKPVGSDVSLKKATYPALLGIETSRRRCGEFLDSAIAELDIFGTRAEPLRWLARYIVQRAQ